MKKLKFLILALVMSLTCFGVASPVQAYADSEVSPASTYVTTNGLGYTINVATATNPLNINLGAPVLDETYLNSLAFVRLYKEQSEERNYKGSSFSYISGQISDDFEASISGGIEYDVFKASVGSDFQDTLAETYSLKESQYYGAYRYEKLVYEEAIPSYTAFSVTYANNYSQAFLYNLSTLTGDNVTEQDYYNFFDIFGTHVVASIKAGGKLQAYYSVVSNTMAYTTSTQNLISSDIDGSISKLAQANTSTKLTLQTSGTTVISNSSYNSRIEVIGGQSQYISTLEEDVGGDFNNWKISLTAENAVIIGYSQGGLIPLWDILPEQYASISTTMETHFNNYIQAENVEKENEFEYSGIKSEYVLGIETPYITLRTNEKTITDSGIAKNHYDTFNFKDKFGLYVGSIKNDGVVYIRVHLKFIAREVNDGYRHVYLYTNNSYSTLLGYYEFEYGEGTVEKVDKQFSHTFGFKLDDLTSDSFIIAYNASGYMDDDWINSNIQVSFELLNYIPE